jgi:hypothetical protein
MPRTEIRVFRQSDGTIPIKDWLDELAADEPRAFKKCLDRILLLERLGSELRRPIADLLRDGIRELRAKVGSVNYRILYFFSGSDIVCLSHGITKEKEIPGGEIDVAIQRKKLVSQDSDRYSTEWEM